MPESSTWIAYLCRLTFHLFLLSSAVSAVENPCYNLCKVIVPRTYVVFSGDIVMQYEIPANQTYPNAFIRLMFVVTNGEDEEIQTQRVPLGVRTGTFSCGIIEKAGRYVFRMYEHNLGQVLTESFMDVRWPQFRLFLPERLFALTSPVNLQVTSQAKCESKLHDTEMQIDLYFQRKNITTGFILKSESYLTQTINYTDISKTLSEFRFPCILFDLNGVYQAVLRSALSSSTVSMSNIMHVVWSKRYTLSIRTESIFPCHDHVTVFYTQPSCAKMDVTLMDRIRVYELKRISNGSMAAPLYRKYITEYFADPDMTSVTPQCDMFNDTSAGFCFVYVSMARNGAVEEQKQLCLSAHPDSDGGWSSWSMWSECTVTCGKGKRSRFRMCDSPYPLHGGRFCSGQTVQWRECHKACPESFPASPLKTVNITLMCACGCQMTSEKGEIIATGRCTHGIWNVEVARKHQIRLSFTYFNLFENKQLVHVRDGESPNDDLLFSSDGNEPSSDVISSSNSMFIELISLVASMSFTNDSSPSSLAIFPYNATLPIHVHGFIASYSSVVIGKVPVSSTIIRQGQSSIMDSKVAVVGIALCGVIIVVTVAFVFFHRFYHKRHKYAMTSSESPIHLSPHSNSAHSSRASSPPPCITHVDIEAPLTGDKKKKETRVSRASSISSTCSTGLKKLRTKAEAVVANGSPKPSTKNYTPLPSPYSANNSPEEFLHDADFFKASPSLKKCQPRSPKVYPSPKLKRSPVTASPSSPPTTKFDLLTKKRQDKLNSKMERVVTGSSCSSSHSPSIPLASPETPTPTGFRDTNLGDSFKQSSPEEKTPQNDVIMLDSLREEPCGTSKDSSDFAFADEANAETTSFIQPSVKARRPISLTKSYSQDSIGATQTDRTADGAKTTKSKKRTKKRQEQQSAMEERQNLLPKPDGQSPKASREDTPKSCISSNSNDSSSKTNKTLSPSRSIHSPSDVTSVDIEMEYDDFIEDDPLSYFERDELQKLKWQGVEKIGKPVVEEED
ncbi:uncharacterized protein LOC121374862 isoform X2 [Gigantopelta aegis]|uniref:uncharacterized protein LOC121374862 isoform X2 n=1 Tax=Gigantopelta aegis TaxID=1735272 RepID=UPI001B8874DD|nr:uncharacterized protein LOC121374862 isoform X2 [Gigantopelta aegis]